MNKKVKATIAAIIVIFLGLGIYTFASPNDEPEELLDGNKQQVVRKTDGEEKEEETDLVQDEEKPEEENEQGMNVPGQNNPRQNTPAGQNTGGDTPTGDNHQEIEVKKEEDPVKEKDTKDYDAAEELVKVSEKSLTEEDLTAAKEVVAKVKDFDVSELEERLNKVSSDISARDLVNDLAKLVKEAESKEDFKNANDYNTTKEVENKVKAVNNTELKSELSEKMTALLKVLKDDKKPSINIPNELITNKEVTITVEDDTNITILLNGKEVNNNTKVSEDGKYTVVVTDEAFNETEVTFEIDTVAPKVTIKTSSVGTEGVYSLIDFKITDNVNLKEAVLNDSYTTNKDGASRSLNFANYGTRYVQGENTWVVYDEAGNSTTITFNFDTVAPEVTVSYSDYNVEGKWMAVKFIANERIKAEDGYTLSTGDTILSKLIYKNTKGEMIITDLAGNETTVNYDVILPDLEPATISLPGVQGRSAMEYRVERLKKVNLEDIIANVSDNYDGDSKLAPYKADLLIGTKEENVYNYDFSNGFDTSKTGRYNVYYKYTDKAGNVSEATLLIVITDETPANLNVSYSTKDWTNKNVLVTLTSDEEMQPLNGWELSNDKLTLTKEFDTNVDEKVVVKDLAGNTTEVQYSVENIDKELPVIAIKNTSKVENGIYRSIDLKLTDNIRVLKTVVNDTKELPRSEGKSKSQDFSGYGKWYKEGENKVVLYDAAGNTTTITFKLDTVAPSVNVTTSNDGKRTNKDVTVKIVANELMQDLAGWNKTDVEDHSEFTKVFAKNETGEVTLKDLAGNEVTTNYKVENIDKVIPKIKEGKLNYSTKEITQGSVTVTIEATKPLYTPTGWTMNGKAYAFKKTYTENTTETVTIKDLYGNTNTFEVVVDNIYPDAEAGAIIDGRSVAVEDLQEFLNTELPDNTLVKIKVLEDLDLDESLVLPENKIVTLDLGKNDVNFEKYNGEEVLGYNIGYSIINRGTLNLIGGNITMDNKNGNVDGTVVPVYFLNYGTMSIKDTVFDMHDDIVIGDNLNKITSIDGIKAIDPEVLNLDTLWDEWDGWTGTDGIVNKDGDIEEIKNCDIEVTYNAVRNMGGNLINIKSGKYLSYYYSAVDNTPEGNLNIFGGKYRTYNDESYEGYEAVNGANIYYKNTSVPGKLKLNSSTNFYEVVEK